MPAYKLSVYTAWESDASAFYEQAVGKCERFLRLILTWKGALRDEESTRLSETQTYTCTYTEHVRIVAGVAQVCTLQRDSCSIIQKRHEQKETRETDPTRITSREQTSVRVEAVSVYSRRQKGAGHWLCETEAKCGNIRRMRA